MVEVAQEHWTMSVALLGRKRSRIALEPDSDDEVEHQRTAGGLRAVSPLAELKRSKTQGELDEIEIVGPEDAWTVDVKSILESPVSPTSLGVARQPHNNAERWSPGESMVVLCVQGNVQLHYDLLCAMLPDLYALSPSLQALVLCRDPATHTPSSKTVISLPHIQAVGPGYNHFVRLGLLHPLGGGDFPLDALVVIDSQGRRRLVLPFGWGAGRYAGTPAGRGVQETLMEKLRSGIQFLVQE